jgi:hypothetical protein
MYSKSLMQQCDPTMTSVPTDETMGSNNSTGSHCYNFMLKQWSELPLLRQCVKTVTSVPTDVTIGSNNNTGSLL